MKRLGIFALSAILSMSFIGNCFADSVMIDPGHGGVDSGAVSYDNTLKEKDLNLDTAKTIIKELEKHGVTVYSTRTEDVYVSLDDRSKMANEIKDLDLFVSVHHNASINGSVNRSEVIYSVKEKESQRLAECIGNKIANMGVEVKIYNRYNAKGNDYYSVLRKTNATSVIVEIAFLTSEEGVSLVDTPEERRKNGILVAQGIMDYFGVDYSSEEQEEAPKSDVLIKQESVIETETKSGLDIINSILNKNSNKNSALNKILSVLGL